MTSLAPNQTDLAQCAETLSAQVRPSVKVGVANDRGKMKAARLSKAYMQQKCVISDILINYSPMLCMCY